MSLKNKIKSFLYNAAMVDMVQQNFLDKNYKKIDVENIGIPPSAFFGLSAPDMGKYIISRFSSLEDANEFVDFYLNRSTEYLDQEARLKFIELKNILKKHYLT